MSPFAEAALALAIAVCVPIALWTLRDDPRHRFVGGRWTAALAVAALSGLSAMLLPIGPLSALLAAVWLLFAVACAGHALAAALARSTFRLEEALLDAAFGYLVVAATWFVAWRSGVAAAEGPHGALLTTLHFHFAGFASLILCTFTARHLRRDALARWPTLRPALVAALIGPAVVALGIVSNTAVEEVAALTLAAGTAAVAVHTLLFVARASRPLGNALLRISAIAALAAMTLVWLYIASPAIAGAIAIDVPMMLRTHGMLNSFGYSLVGLIGWALLGAPVGAITGRIPFSRVASGGRVGRDFFERRALTSGTSIAKGLVDSLDEFASAEFTPAAVDQRIRAVYEDTGSFEFTLFPEWRPPWRSLSGAYAAISAWLEQIHYLRPGAAGEKVESRIVDLDALKDGRPGVRGWVRWYPRTGKAIYVAAYATHRDAHRVYMNIAFPLPGGNLASILRLSNLDGSALLLTSRSHLRAPGHEGVYFATRIPARLPIDETIRVWAVHDPAAPGPLAALARANSVSLATHEVWVFGLHVLTLSYTIERVGAVRSSGAAVE